MDAALELATVCLPTILSIVGIVLAFKIHDPKDHKAWFAGLLIAGIFISLVTYWQQKDSRTQHQREIGELNRQFNAMKNNLDDLQKSTGAMQETIKVEVERRKQAEAENQRLIVAVGTSTRQGVVSDIKQSPIKVQINGHAENDRNPNSLYQFHEMVGDIQGAVVSKELSEVSFAFVHLSQRIDPTREIEYQDWTLACPDLPTGQAGFIGVYSASIAGMKCKIMRKK